MLQEKTGISLLYRRNAGLDRTETSSKRFISKDECGKAEPGQSGGLEEVALPRGQEGRKKTQTSVKDLPSHTQI